MRELFGLLIDCLCEVCDAMFSNQIYFYETWYINFKYSIKHIKLCTVVFFLEKLYYLSLQ